MREMGPSAVSLALWSASPGHAAVNQTEEVPALGGGGQKMTHSEPGQ